MKKQTYFKQIALFIIAVIRCAAFCFCILLTGKAHAQYTLLPIAGNDSAGYYGEGVPARHASLYTPGSICRDAAGNLYIGDGGVGGVRKYMRVRRIDAGTGTITTIAGSGSTLPAGDSVDNAAATTAGLRGLAGLCIDREGNLLIADGGNRVRKVLLATGIISTVVGNINVLPGYAGDGGPATAAQSRSIWDVSVDRANNIYFADFTSHVVRKVNAVTGIISTVAGTGVAGFSGDGGPSTAAQLNGPVGLYVDSADNVFIAGNGASGRIRRIDAVTGIITTIAGDASATGHGDGGPATASKLGQPTKMTMDRQGNLFFTETMVSAPRISRIDAATGIITTVAGTGLPFISDTTGDNGPATAVAFGGTGICMDTCGNIFLTGWRHRIRALVHTVPADDWLCGLKLTHPVTGINELQGTVLQGLTVAPNPSSGAFTLTISSQAGEVAYVAITDITGRVVQGISMQTNKETPVQLQAPPGLYMVTATTAGGRTSANIVIE